MIFLLFGPPGCGKGTQAAFLSERYGIPAISTGEMFRAECKAGTELGKLACSILSKGGLVGDEIVNGIVAKRIQKSDCTAGFLLDGYPRTVQQALHFANMLLIRQLPEPVIIHIDVADDALVSRLTARRQCPKCMHIYNVLSHPPKEKGRCDHDGAELITRDDDRESVIRDRLTAYHEQTGLVLEWYSQFEIVRVDGSGTPDQVSKAIDHALRFRPVATLVH